MDQKNTISQLIDEWKPRKTLAAEIGANVEAVHKWARTNRVPSEWQARVVRAAKAKGLSHIDGDWMVHAHEPEAGA